MFPALKWQVIIDDDCFYSRAPNTNKIEARKWLLFMIDAMCGTKSRMTTIDRGHSKKKPQTNKNISNNFRLHVQCEYKMVNDHKSSSFECMNIKCQPPTRRRLRFYLAVTKRKKNLKIFYYGIHMTKTHFEGITRSDRTFCYYFFPPFRPKVFYFYIFFFVLLPIFGLFRGAQCHCHWKTIMTDLSMTTSIEKLFILLLSSSREKKKKNKTKHQRQEKNQPRTGTQSSVVAVCPVCWLKRYG